MFPLMTERGDRDRFLDAGKTRNFRSSPLELTHAHVLLTIQSLNKRSPEWLEIVKPPAWRRTTQPVLVLRHMTLVIRGAII